MRLGGKHIVWFVYVLFLMQEAGLLAQATMLGFNNKHLIQSNLLMPAFRPQYGLAFSINNQLVSYFPQITPGDLFNGDENNDLTLTRLLSDPQKQLTGIDVENHVNLITVGYRKKFSYLSFNSGIVSQMFVNADKDAIGLLYKGNGHKDYYGRRVDVDFGGSFARAYWENRVTWGLVLTDYFNVGFTVSRLKGLYNYELSKANFGLLTDTSASNFYNVTMDAEWDLQTSGTRNLLPVAPKELFPGGGINRGLSYGFGALLRPSEQWQFSIGAINYGNINWNHQREYYRLARTTYTFKGLDTANMAGQVSADNFTGVIDSVSVAFKGERGSGGGALGTTIPSQWNYGIEYFLTPSNTVSFSFASGVGATRTKRCWTLQSQNRIKENIDLMVSYTRYNMGIERHLMGLGFIGYKGPLQVHLLINNVKGVVDFAGSHGMMIDAGFTYIIGRNVDADNDDVPDYRDECKGMFGRRNYLGCPEDMPGKPYEYVPAGKELKEIERLEEKRRWRFGK